VVHIAVDQEHEMVTRLLLDKENDVETKTNDGWMVLFLAAGNGSESLVRLLPDLDTNHQSKDTR
jgi:ankyrin repeat protein